MSSHGVHRNREREMLVKVIKWKLEAARKCIVVSFPEATKRNARLGFEVESGIC